MRRIEIILLTYLSWHHVDTRLVLETRGSIRSFTVISSVMVLHISPLVLHAYQFVDVVCAYKYSSTLFHIYRHYYCNSLVSVSSAWLLIPRARSWSTMSTVDPFPVPRTSSPDCGTWPLRSLLMYICQLSRANTMPSTVHAAQTANNSQAI